MEPKGTMVVSATENQLIQKAFGGDRGAFGLLVKRYQSPVYSTCVRFLGTEDGKDAAQEVFLKAFVHRERFQSDRAVLPWLLTIARNLCLDKLRRRKPETELTSATEPGCTDHSAEEQLVSKQSLEMVRLQMQQLPEGQREALILYHVDGLPYREISNVLNVPQGTIMTWLHRGRQTIVSALKRSEK